MSSNNNNDNDAAIHMETVTAPTNIACIKYWGKASISLNTAINSSVSITLSQDDLRAVTTAAASKAFPSDKLWLNGKEEDISRNKRFRACVEGVKALASDRIDPANGQILVKKEEWSQLHVHVSSYNTFPTAAGLASSAAGYAALVTALAKLYCAKETYPGQLSAIARQGSGSACRSLYGGFVAWQMGSKPDGTDSIATQLFDEHHWPEIRALIMVVSDLKKDTASTAGMTTSVATSQLLSHRASQIVPKRMQDIATAYANRDFATFGKITMQDSNQFHAICLDTYPPIFYLNDVSRSIIQIVHAYNDWAGEIRVAYTFDAGPNAVLYTLEKYVVELLAILLTFYPGDAKEYVSHAPTEQTAKEYVLDPSLMERLEKTGREKRRGDVKMIYCTKSGPGPQVLSSEEALIDDTTGLNTYQP